MPLNYLNERLLDSVGTWNGSGCVILVDESTGDDNASNDRDASHRVQAGVLARAGMHGLGVYLVAFGGAGTSAPFGGNLSADLNGAIPPNTTVYYKGAFDTDGFSNDQLGAAIAHAGHAHAIIMGQSRNACCAATARGAVAAGLTVHTAPSLTRGGNVATADFQNFNVAYAGWPNGTNIYAGV